MSYKYITKYDSPNFGYPDGTRGQNKPREIIVHWWGGGTFDGVLNWLCNPRAGVSAHYVLEAGKVACIVNLSDAAWHAGSRTHNTQSIGIECNTRCSAGDRETLAELIAKLWKEYGRLKVIGHKDVASTACPGTYYKYLPSIIKRAEEIYSGKKKPKSGIINKLKKEKISLPLRGYYKLGDIGSGVKKLQKYLKEKGFYNGKIDGEFGKQTLKAVKEFQTVHKLVVDGLFGKMCRKAM